MEAVSIDCRNKHWSQCFNQILISSTYLVTVCSAIAVQAALESRAACTTTAGPIVIKPVDEFKIWLKHSDQCLFLQPILSASIFKLIFGFCTWIPRPSTYIWNLFKFLYALNTYVFICIPLLWSYPYEMGTILKWNSRLETKGMQENSWNMLL